MVFYPAEDDKSPYVIASEALRTIFAARGDGLSRFARSDGICDVSRSDESFAPPVIASEARRSIFAARGDGLPRLARSDGICDVSRSGAIFALLCKVCVRYPDGFGKLVMNTPVNPESVTIPALLKPGTEAWALGMAGLLPFVAGAAGLWLLSPEWAGLAALALLTYAAVIVSFLGGIHWGLAMPLAQTRRGLLIWGLLPSLLAWAGLLLNSVWGLLLMAASLLLCYIVDCQIYRSLRLGGWLGLRGMLTFVAVLSCLAGAAAFMAQT